MVLIVGQLQVVVTSPTQLLLLSYLLLARVGVG